MIHIGKLVPRNQDVEIVERKGLGHPDTICDGIAETFSRALSNYYLENFGTILHHNVDKGLLIGGEAKPEFGGGEVISPITIIIAGRATKLVEKKVVPVDEIAMKSSLDYLEKNFRNLDPDVDVDIDIRVRQGSADLSHLISKHAILSNDTSFGVGFYPLSKLETHVLKIEGYLNSDDFHRKNPWLGEDIKVMGLRLGDSFKFTIAAAFVSKYINSLDTYLDHKEKLLSKLQSLDKTLNAEYFINTADDPDESSVYITVTGLSAEAGDDGQVGRGNRANGLITPNRLMSLEALAGKNPVNHVGKLYNILAQRISEHVVEETSAEQSEVFILSQIGKPLNKPQALNILISPDTRNLENKVEYIANYWLENISDITNELVNGKIRIF